MPKNVWGYYFPSIIFTSVVTSSFVMIPSPSIISAGRVKTFC